jgi:NAD(P)-dependent dehydrogenase (short-subunit alcohol dehydrogenase family)
VNRHLSFSIEFNQQIGLGFETVRSLAKAGAQVVLTARSVSKGNEAKLSIVNEHPDAAIDVMQLDLSSFESIRNFSKNVGEKYPSIDVLINNAGVMALPERVVTYDGLEMQIGTNHFGHFLLTSLIFPLLAQNGRVVNHASSAYIFAAENFPAEDIQSTKAYSPWTAYGNSKIANLFFTYELNHRLQKNGNPKNIQSLAVHPGYSATNLQTGRFPMYEQLNQFVAMKAEHGAQSQILAAVGVGVGAEPKHGTMIGPKYFAIGAPAIGGVGEKASSQRSMEILWDESNRITAANFFA